MEETYVLKNDVRIRNVDPELNMVRVYHKFLNSK